MNGFIDRSPDNFGASRRSAHEWGHGFFALVDEYVNLGSWYCGHSIMGNDFWHPFWNNICVDSDHNRDPTPPGTSGGPATSAHRLAFNAGLSFDWEASAGTITPDNYDYADFDFNGTIGTVVNQNF